MPGLSQTECMTNGQQTRDDQYSDTINKRLEGMARGRALDGGWVCGWVGKYVGAWVGALVLTDSDICR